MGRGVAVIINKNISDTVGGHWEISDRILLVRLHGNIMQAYALAVDSSFYDHVDNVMKQCKQYEIMIIMEDFNTKVETNQKIRW